MDTQQLVPSKLSKSVRQIGLSSFALLPFLLLCIFSSSTQAQLFSKQPTGSASAVPNIASANSTAIQCELRIVWGGPQPEAVRGTISVDQGIIKTVRNLCVAQNAGACFQDEPHKILLKPNFTDTFGGLDLSFQGPANAKITFDLRLDGSENTKRFEFELHELLSNRLIESLTEEGWKLAIERPIHDRFQLRGRTGESILAPQSEWTITCEGNHSNLPSGTYVVEWQLYSTARNRLSALGKPTAKEIRIDEAGSWDPIQLPVLTPAEEGVYAVVAKIRRKRFYSSIVNPEVALSRRLDFVILDPNQDAAEQLSWTQLQQLDAVRAIQSDVVGWVNKWSNDWLGTRTLPPFAFSDPSTTLSVLYNQTQNLRKYIPLGDSFDLPEHSGELGVREISNKQMSLIGESDELSPSDVTQALTIAPRGWVKIPIPANLDPSKLHRLRAVCPTDLPQELLFSVRNDLPAASVFGNDSGLRLSAHDCFPGGTVDTDIQFWPNESSYLLIHNPQETRIASLFRFELAAANPKRTTPSNTSGQIRSIYLKIDKPWLSDSLTASRELDPSSSNPLDSWATWFEAAKHFEYALASTNSDVAILTVMTEGGSLMAIDELHGSARFDSGTFFSDGRSPQPKDFVDLLLRRLDRGNKKLVLSIDLESMLPDLAEQYAKGTTVETQSISGEKWSEQHPTARPDPLDSRLQESVSKLIKKITSLYKKHRSFGGISFRLSKRSLLVYPDSAWGYSEELLNRFCTDARVRIAKGNAVVAFQSEAIKLAFLNWRAKKLAEFFQKQSELLMRHAPNTTFALEVDESLLGSELPEGLAQQQLPASALLGHGIDLDYLNSLEGIAILAGQQNWANRSERIIQTPLPQLPGSTLPTLKVEPDAKSLEVVTVDSSQTTRLLPASQAGNTKTRRALVELFAEQDQLGVVLSGWQPQSSLAPAVSKQLQTISAFPRVEMQTVAVMPFETFLDARKALAFRRAGQASIVDRSPIRVRIAKAAPNVQQSGRRQVIQVVNLAPWEQRIYFRVQTSNDFPDLMPLIEHNVELERFEGGILAFTIEPYDVIGWQTDDPGFQLVDVSQQTGGNLERVQEELLQLENSIARTADPTQQLPLANLHGGFEIWQTEQRPLGWNCSSLPNVQIAPSRELPHSGQYSLRISNKNPQQVSAWIQSEQIDIPSTGKLAFHAWLRKPAAGREVQVRLSVVGRTLEGERFERSQTYGGRSASREVVPNDWGRRPFSIFVRDLPVSQLDSLYVAIDLIGEGEIWVDDASVNLIHLLPDERNYLRGQLLVAKQSLAAGNPFPAEQLLSSPGGQMLKELNSRSIELASRPGEPSVQMRQGTTGQTQQPPQRQSLLERFRSPFSNPWKR